MNLITAFKDYLDSRSSQERTHVLLSRDDTAAALKSLPFQIGYQGQPWNYYGSANQFPLYSKSQINYAQEVGDLRNSSLIMAAVRWVARNLQDARLKEVTLDKDRKETEVNESELVALFKRPNPFYTGRTLLSGFAVSWIMYGNVYFLKIRSRMNRVVELWWEPNWTIEPKWPQDGSKFISHYEVNRNGRLHKIAVEDVISFHDIGLDPATRKAMNATAALIREFYTDGQAINLLAMLLRNGLVPPAMVSVGDKDNPGPIGKEFEALKSDIQRRFSGDEAMKPFVANGAINVSKMGYEYDKVGVKEVREIPEERFAAAMGISVISLQLGAGLKHSAYNNVREYHSHDYRSYIVPLQTYIADELDRQMLPEFGETQSREMRWDYSQVAVMQPDKNKEWERIEGAYKSRILDQAEAREAMGYKFDESHQGVYYPVPSNNITLSPLEETPEPEPIEDDTDDLMPAEERPRPKLVAKKNGHSADGFELMHSFLRSAVTYREM